MPDMEVESPPSGSRARVERVTQSVRDYSRAIAPGPSRDQLAAVGAALLRGTVAAMRADEGVAWASPDDVEGLPLATCPPSLPARRVQVARRWARRMLPGEGVAVSRGALILVAAAASPGGVFVLLRRGNAPFSVDDRALLTRLPPLLAAGLSMVPTPTDLFSPVNAVDPSRATLDLLAVLAHEMRTPLALIKGYATALINQSEPWDLERVRQALQIIDQETSTLTSLIAELLEAAAIDGGRMMIEPEPVLLNRLLERLVAEFARQASRHRFVLAFPSRWPAIMADLRRLEQVFRNILDNAVKYSPQGGQITVNGTVTRRQVVVSIADQGVGIAPADLNRLFEKFFRVRGAVRVVGSGLGLPIAHAIVERHGGRIWAESRLGKGTTMHVALPRQWKGSPP